MSGGARPWKIGDPHTAETRAKIVAANTKWTADELEMLVLWYRERDGKKLELGRLAVVLGRNRQVISRKARSLGLTKRSRPTGRKPGRKHPTDEESRRATGEATRRRLAEKGHPRGALGLKHSAEARSKMGEASRRMNAARTPEDRRRIAEKALATKLAKYGCFNPGMMRPDANPYSRCKYGRRDDLGGQFFRSRWEANYARYLNFLQARKIIDRWEYEPDTFWFESIRRGVRSYTPDFKVYERGRVYYVEVKGWLDAKSKTKIARMKRYHPTVDLRLFGEKAYRELERKIAGAIPGWETE